MPTQPGASPDNLTQDAVGAPLPKGRYGSARGERSPKAGQRLKRGLFTALAIAVSTAVAYVAYVNLGPAPISAERLGFQETSPTTMEITLSVKRDEPEKAGVCIIRVRNITGAESGRKEIYLPPGAGSVVLKTVIASIDRPVTADVFGCSYDVPGYLSSP